MKNIYLVVAPSGAGKTAITDLLETKYQLKSIRSYTTRPKRYDGEIGHIFISNEEFDNLTNIVAFTEFCGYRYCVTQEQVDTHDLYIVDPKGIEYFKKAYQGNKGVKIIYIESDITARYSRMTWRAESNGVDYIAAVDSALKRISNDITEFYEYCHGTAQVDFVIDNGSDANLYKVVDEIYKFICSCEAD